MHVLIIQKIVIFVMKLTMVQLSQTRWFLLIDVGCPGVCRVACDLELTIICRHVDERIQVLSCRKETETMKEEM